MPKKQPHFHKYQRFIWPNGKHYYRCIETNCSHYLPILDLVINKESLCHGVNCNNLVLITQEDVSKGIVKPMCDSCRDKRKKEKEEMLRV